ncbi:biotin--[acetyl-CoA-carboxylase] ligase [bacterium]|nr:biotin--[acetyl-CoA-carboxylase] ligase [bacterium]
MSASAFEKKLVDALRANEGRYLDETALRREMGLGGAVDEDDDSGGDIPRAVELLRLQGWGVDGDEVQGWRLYGAPECLNYLEVENALTTSFLGRCLFVYRILGSTNQTARMLAESGAPDGTLLVAEEQSRGRGRSANAWHSPAGGGIWASLILRPGIAPERLGTLGILVACSICLAVEETTGLQPLIKWPNDILIGGRKVAGILCESGLAGQRLRHVILGFGLNVNLEEFPAPLRRSATSLSLAAGGRRFDRVQLLSSILDHLEQGYLSFLTDGFSACLPRVQRRDFLRDREVEVETPDRGRLRGRARGIDEAGALLLECPPPLGPCRIEQGHVVAF